MTKLCSACGIENRDEVQFCRACGTIFTAPAETTAASAEDGQLAAGISCDECGFQNKPGIRYCANCGVSLLGTVIVPRPRAGTPQPADETSGGFSPPPISYPSFAAVAPYPEAADESAPYERDDPPVDDDAAARDLPDYDAPLESHAPAAYDAQSTAPGLSQAAPHVNRAPLIIGAVVLLFAATAAGAWWFMGGSDRSQPVAAAASAPAVAASVAPPPLAPIPVEPAQAAIPVETAPASSPIAPFTNEAVVAPPPAVEAAASDAEARRVAAEKRREKAAKDRADREAKGKALADEQQAAGAVAARAEQEAQARRRAEETQRPRVQSAPQPQPPAAAQMRGVREICAGRGTIAQAICQSRECGAPEHANETICKQIRDADDRRRNYSN